jgi:hypothetical protein
MRSFPSFDLPVLQAADINFAQQFHYDSLPDHDQNQSADLSEKMTRVVLREPPIIIQLEGSDFLESTFAMWMTKTHLVELATRALGLLLKPAQPLNSSLRNCILEYSTGPFTSK